MYKIIIAFIAILLSNTLNAQEECYSPNENSPCCNGIIRTDPRNGAAFNPERLGNFNKAGKVPTSNPNIFITEYTTDFYPLSCFENGVFSSKEEGGYEMGAYNYRLKLLINFEFEKNYYGVVNHSVQEITYKFNEKIVPFAEDWTETAIFQYPDYITLTGTTYQQNTVEQALNKVIITGDIYSSQGATTEIIAGEKIIVEAGVEIGPNVHLRIDFSNGCVNNPIEPASEENVNSFCGSKELYKADVLTNKALIGNPILQNSNLSSQKVLNANFGPNPANEFFKITFNQAPADNISIIITDLMGRLVKEHSVNGSNSAIEISTIDLSSGLYIVTIRTDHNQWIEKVMIAH